MPFARLSRVQWANLGLTALSGLYLFFVLFQLMVNKPFHYVAIDLVSPLATASIAREHGLAAVYDPSLQEQYQQRLYMDQGTDWPYGTNPMLFLPVFVIGLVPLSFLEPFTAYLIWTVFNIAILFVYILRLLKELQVKERHRIAFCLLVSLPVFLTLIFGQVNVWLGICVGESFLAFRKQQELRAGAWLAGLLLKPQILVLLIPGLAVARKYRILFWAGVTGLVLVVLSTLLVGKDGMISLLSLWMGSAQPEGLATNAPELMMNWRGLALRLAEVWPDKAWTWILAAGGMLGTAGLALGTWLYRAQMTMPRMDKIWLGTLAGTFAVTWHSHVHMGLALVVLTAFIWADTKRLPLILLTWLYLPPVFFLATSLARGTDVAHANLGTVLLVLNVLVTGWSAFSILKAEKTPTQRLAGAGGVGLS